MHNGGLTAKHMFHSSSQNHHSAKNSAITYLLYFLFLLIGMHGLLWPLFPTLKK